MAITKKELQEIDDRSYRKVTLSNLGELQDEHFWLKIWFALYVMKLQG